MHTLSHTTHTRSAVIWMHTHTLTPRTHALLSVCVSPRDECEPNCLCHASHTGSFPLPTTSSSICRKTCSPASARCSEYAYKELYNEIWRIFTDYFRCVFWSAHTHTTYVTSLKWENEHIRVWITRLHDLHACKRIMNTDRYITTS